MSRTKKEAASIVRQLAYDLGIRSESEIRFDDSNGVVNIHFEPPIDPGQAKDLERALLDALPSWQATELS